jgi:hypothetical protein
MRKINTKNFEDGKDLIARGIDLLTLQATEAADSLIEVLTELVRLVPATDLSEPLIEKLKSVSEITGELLSNVETSKPNKRASKTSIEDKKGWLRQRLEDAPDKSMFKSDLIVEYSKAFRCKPSPTILDAAIEKGSFPTEREGKKLRVNLPLNPSVAKKKGG